MRSASDLLSRYAQYHRDQRNITTHFVGMPMIVFGLSVLLARLQWPVGGTVLTPAWGLFAAAALWYLTRGEPLLGAAVSAALCVLVAAAHPLAGGGPSAWLGWGIGLAALGWLFQCIGHWYEGRTPGFAEDLVGLLVGPMFITAEALFSIGWNKPLQAEIERRAGRTYLRNMAHPA